MTVATRKKAGHREKTGFWQTPRTTGVRRVALQIHLWAGVLIGMYASLIGLTGSALVFEEELTRVPLPVLSERVEPPLLQSIFDDVARRFPTYEVQGVQSLDARHAPISLWMTPRAPASASQAIDQFNVLVDRRSGTILSASSRYSGWLGACANLHIYLFAGTTGYTLNGMLAVCFLAVCFSGWILWWPGVRHWLQALRLHWRARWRRLLWDFHTVIGFWANGILIAVIVTGIFFVWPQPFVTVLGTLSQADKTKTAGYFGSAASARPAPGLHRITADQALGLAIVHFPAGVEASVLALPAGTEGCYEITGYYPGTAPYATPVRVSIDQYTGRVLASFDALQQPWGIRLILLAYAIHFGSFAHVASKCVWFVLGLLPALLLCSGLIMWWNRSLHRSWLATKLRGSGPSERALGKRV